MAKKRCLFGWMCRLFDSEENPKTEKKSERWRWIIGRLKFKHYPALPAPETTVDQVTETQRRHALTVALATAAAAEAAVAAAQAAAEVVRLTGASKSHYHFNSGDENLAATKIQSAFRAYLARKALRALKGLVKLQAIVRGRAVRRRVTIKMKHLPSNAKMQPEVRLKSICTVDETCKDGVNKQLLNYMNDVKVKENKVKHHRKGHQSGHMLECSSQRNWDFSMLSSDDVTSLCLRKQEASIKRERMMKYSFSNRERGNAQILEELLSSKGSGRHSHLMERWLDNELYNREGVENLKSRAISNLLNRDDVFDMVQVKTRNTQRKDSIEGLNSPSSFPRRSFGRARQSTSLENSSMPNSPVFPTYMVATESARLKTRSMSAPKQRGVSQEASFDCSFPHKHTLAHCPSYNGEPFGASGKSGASRHVSATHHF